MVAANLRCAAAREMGDECERMEHVRGVVDVDVWLVEDVEREMAVARSMSWQATTQCRWDPRFVPSALGCSTRLFSSQPPGIT